MQFLRFGHSFCVVGTLDMYFMYCSSSCHYQFLRFAVEWEQNYMRLRYKHIMNYFQHTKLHPFQT